MCWGNRCFKIECCFVSFLLANKSLKQFDFSYELAQSILCFSLRCWWNVQWSTIPCCSCGVCRCRCVILSWILSSLTSASPAVTADWQTNLLPCMDRMHWLGYDAKMKSKSFWLISTFTVWVHMSLYCSQTCYTLIMNFWQLPSKGAHKQVQGTPPTAVIKQLYITSALQQ